MILKSGIPLLLFLSSVQASQDADQILTGLRDVRYRHFLEGPRSMSYISTRTKRSAIFSTGVKVCPQETAKAVISSHRAYYKLRVCQEAIWEAFRIFFDRVPNSEEYMAWVYTCQHENLCMDDLARNFSSSPEHLDMVARRVAELGDSEGVLAETPEPGKDCPWTLQSVIGPTEPSVILEEPNLIPEKPQQYIVEFSVAMEDPIYGEILRDPATPQYADVVRELRDKMYHVFARIPGFKEIQVLGFRAEDVSVRYAVLFNGDTELSDQPEGYHASDVGTERDMTAPKLQNIIIKALKQEHSLPLDLNTLSFDAVYEVEDHMNKMTHTVVPPGEESSTVAMAASKHLEASITSMEAQTVMSSIPEGSIDVIWFEAEQTSAHPAMDAVTQVEHLPPSQKERDGLSEDSPTTDPADLFSDDTSTQIIEFKATVPTSLDLPAQHDGGDGNTTMKTAAEEEEEIFGGNNQDIVPLIEDSTLTATEPENTLTDGDSVPTEGDSVSTEGDDTLSSKSSLTEEEGDSLFTELDSGLSRESSVAEDESVSTESTEEDNRFPSESTFTEGDSVLTQGGSVSSEGDSVSSEGYSVSSEGDSALTEGDSLSSEGDSVLTQEDSLSTEGDSVLTGGDGVLTQEDSLSTEGDIVLTEGDSVLNEGDSISTEGDSVLTEGDSMLTEEGSVFSEGDSVLTEGDSMLTEGGSVSSEGDSVPSVGDSVLTEGGSVSSEGTGLDSGLSPESLAPEEDSGSGLSPDVDRAAPEWTPAPAMRQASTPLMAAVERSKDLVVFFRLRVSNMMFTDSLFNKDSAEYKSLENTFLELLLPYLETNLTGFKALEILSFQNGSVIVNSKMKLNKAVPYNVTEAVHCVLEDFCNSASSQLDIQVDSRSLEVEPADEPDPCQSMTCSEFSRCMIDGWSGEAECVCDPGYSAVEGQPCQSLCSLQPDFCLNGGLCQNIPGHGATCSCPVGKYWHYHGERCDELITLPLDTSLIVTALVGSLCLVGAVIGILLFINKKCIKPQKAVTVVSPDSSTQQDQKS